MYKSSSKKITNGKVIMSSEVKAATNDFFHGIYAQRVKLSSPRRDPSFIFEDCAEFCRLHAKSFDNFCSSKLNDEIEAEKSRKIKVDILSKLNIEQLNQVATFYNINI